MTTIAQLAAELHVAPFQIVARLEGPVASDAHELDEATVARLRAELRPSR